MFPLLPGLCGRGSPVWGCVHAELFTEACSLVMTGDGTNLARLDRPRAPASLIYQRRRMGVLRSSAHAWGRSRLASLSTREEMEAQPPHSHRQHDDGKGQREGDDHCADNDEYGRPARVDPSS